MRPRVRPEGYGSLPVTAPGCSKWGAPDWARAEASPTGRESRAISAWSHNRPLAGSTLAFDPSLPPQRSASPRWQNSPPAAAAPRAEPPAAYYTRSEFCRQEIPLASAPPLLSSPTSGRHSALSPDGGPFTPVHRLCEVSSSAESALDGKARQFQHFDLPRMDYPSDSSPPGGRWAGFDHKSVSSDTRSEGLPCLGTGGPGVASDRRPVLHPHFRDHDRSPPPDAHARLRQPAWMLGGPAFYTEAFLGPDVRPPSAFSP
ncbi:hypothetical protein DIPPA_30041 [Diplonema papillatum]|nr:hypothetical protein DIPPA_30041 [Diplonema papillatum]